jgi:hypothetical protein
VEAYNAQEVVRADSLMDYMQHQRAVLDGLDEDAREVQQEAKREKDGHGVLDAIKTRTGIARAQQGYCDLWGRVTGQFGAPAAIRAKPSHTNNQLAQDRRVDSRSAKSTVIETTATPAQSPSSDGLPIEWHRGTGWVSGMIHWHPKEVRNACPEGVCRAPHRISVRRTPPN